MGGLLTLNSFVTTFPQIDTTKAGEMGLSAAETSTRSTVQGITTASYNLGCFFGAIFCIWIGNYLGRRKTIFTGSVIMVIGATLQSCAYSLPHLIVGRIVTGIGNGLNTSTVRKYSSMSMIQCLWSLTLTYQLPGSPSAASPTTVASW
jgi:MFS family permease